MRNITLLVVWLLLSGCVLHSHNKTIYDIRMANAEDLSLVLSSELKNESLQLTLENVSNNKIWYDYEFPNFFIWCVREGEPPVQLMSRCIDINLSDIHDQILYPGQTKSYELSLNDYEYLGVNNQNLMGGLIYLEDISFHNRVGRSLYSNSIRIDQNIVIKGLANQGMDPTESGN